ncbi:hypothetical protein D3C85_1736340 [compost metagenome]
MNFKVSENETKSIAEFYELCNQVNDLKEVPYDALTYTYCFTPTGIGSVLKVKCNQLDLQKDVTDYECW